MTTFQARAASAALVFFATLPAFGAASSPQEALGLARQQIASGDCRGAVRTLEEALPQAAAIAEGKERGEALAAMHFYSAVVQSDCGDREKAKEHLRRFFEFRPGRSTLDETKYKRPFLALFDQVQRELGSGGEMFDRFYPGFDDAAAVDEEAQLPLDLWSTSAAFQLLASDQEREAWGRLRDAQSRAAFVNDFWKRRDPDLATEVNERRADVARRVAFADRFFGAANELRGAMSDRGRVLILLGPPARVHRQALQRYQTTFVTPRERTPLSGTMERWVYFKPQLVGVAAQQVEIRFITQPGYGESVMQRDFWPLKALAAARQAPR